jgi:hypothetical protein
MQKTQERSGEKGFFMILTDPLLQKSQGDLLYKSQEKGPDNELKSE